MDVKKTSNYLYKYAQNHGARTQYQLDIDGSSVTTVELEMQQQRELSEKRKEPKLQTPQPFPLVPRSGNVQTLYPHMMMMSQKGRDNVGTSFFGRRGLG